MADDEIIGNIEKLLDIAREGSIESVHSFLATTGLDINCAADDDETVLMLAVANDDVAAVKCLTAAGADVDRKNMNGVTALMWAASYGHVECLEVLLRAGANKSLTDSEGKTVLMFAVLGRPQLELNENIEDCVKFLINVGVDVNAQNLEGKTALMFATENSWGRRCICHLISAGADANLLDKDGRTALMHAAATYSSSDIDTVIDIPFKSRFEFENFYEGFPVSPEDGCVVPLIRACSDINKQDKDGRTALMIACATRHVWCVASLALSGADVNIRDTAGRTALMYSVIRDSFFLAVAKNYEDLHSAGFLVHKGADVNMRDNEGMTALMFAARSGFHLTAQVLVNGGSDMEQKDKMRRTALIHALIQIKLLKTDPYVFDCLDKNFLIVSFLLQEGASPVLSEEFQPLIDQIAGDNLQNNYYNMHLQSSYYNLHFLQFLICNGSTYFRLEYSPFTDIDTQEPDELLPYLFANCCIFDEDLKLATESNLRQYDDNNIQLFMEKAFSNPWPLVKLAFIAVSSAIGHSPGRHRRVRQTKLPLPIQDCLLFRRPIALLPVHHWKDIPLCFNPVEYEQLPAPYPLLYNWPFGRELVKCECKDCHGKSVNFQL